MNAKDEAWREHMKTYDRDRSHNPDFSSTRHRKHCFDAGWDTSIAEALKRMGMEIIVEPDGDAFHAYCPTLKGLHIDGATEQDAFDHALDGVALYVDSLIRHEAAAVAEARAPLVGLLKSIEWQSYRGHLVCPSCNGATIPWLRDGKLQPPGHAADCPLAAALAAKETPDAV